MGQRRYYEIYSITHERILPVVLAGSLAAASAHALSGCGGDSGIDTGMKTLPEPSCPSNQLSIEVESGNDGRCHETNPPYNPNPTVQVLGISRPGMLRLFSAYVPYGTPCPTDLSAYRQIGSQSVDGDIPYAFFPLRSLTSDTCLRAVQVFTNSCSPLASATYRFSCGQ
ncbi:MAG: hypothetical protein IPJ69_00115 [Deltaproteobacteria bacterium]|nr:MAG: hypothetical protein IPJ69_00115 [Deltaproteobacteria bacterium]